MSCIYMTKNEMMTTFKKVAYVLEQENDNPYCCARYASRKLIDVMLEADKWQRDRYGEDTEPLTRMELERVSHFKVCSIEEAFKSFQFFGYQIDDEDDKYNKNVQFLEQTLLKIYCYRNTDLFEKLDQIEWGNKKTKSGEKEAPDFFYTQKLDHCTAR